MYTLNKNLFKFSNLDTRVMYTGATGKQIHAQSQQ